MAAGPPRAFPESIVSLMLILSLAVQVGLIAHVIKTGRSMIWILAIAFLPLAGALAYVVVEILPGCAETKVEAGEAIEIVTPTGGGWGIAE